MIFGWCIGNGGFLCIYRLLFHIMLGMDSVGIRILGEQAQRECGSRIHCAFYFQDSFVQFAQTFDQSKPDARTRCLIFAFCLIIAIENVWKRFGVNAMAGITDTDFRVFYLVLFY